MIKIQGNFNLKLTHLRLNFSLKFDQSLTLALIVIALVTSAFYGYRS